MVFVITAGVPSAFGPVPSRRLGRSLGINNIPPKICDYGCVYCQVGRTFDMQVDRRTHYRSEDVVAVVRDHVRALRDQGEPIDYLTFVPTGEPTLDRHLGREIQELKGLGLKIAVITNGSLVTRLDVRRDLTLADWVSLKVDATVPRIWRRINRPHGSLELPAIQDGMREFAREFTGDLVTETMLIRGVNDAEVHLRQVAAFLGELAPRTAYLSVPTRPPARGDARPPESAVLHQAFRIVGAAVDSVEFLLGYEGDEFAATGDAAADLLGITAVHPMTTDAVESLLSRTGADWSVVDDLLVAGSLVAVPYEDDVFYVRSVRRSQASGEESQHEH